MRKFFEIILTIIIGMVMPAYFGKINILTLEASGLVRSKKWTKNEFAERLHKILLAL